MKRCQSNKDDRLRTSKNGRIHTYRNRTQRTTAEGRFPDCLEAAEGGKSGGDSRRGKPARGTRRTGKDQILSDSFSCSSSKCSEVVVELAGTADKVVDATGKMTGTANNVVVGTANNVAGTSGDVAGTADSVAGTADAAIFDPAVQTTTTTTSSSGTSNDVASPVDELDLDLVTLKVSCGENEAQLRLNDLRGGSRRSCVLHNGAWLTPNEFQTVSGRGNAKDWKRSIRHHGRPLKALLEQGLLSTAPAFCLCSVCDSQGPEIRSNEHNSIAPDSGVAAKPIKRNEEARTRTKTKISSSANERSYETVRRQKSRKALNAVEFSIRKRNSTKKTNKTNEAPSRGGGQNQYGRRGGGGARNSGKTTTTTTMTKRKSTTAGSDLCSAKSTDVASKRNAQRLPVKSKKGERPNGKRGKGRGRGKAKGKGKEMDKSGNATDDNFRLAGDDDDDDSRTIIDCGELFVASEPTPLIRQRLNEAPVPLDDDREEGVGADDDDRDNRKSRGISAAAKPELAFCGNFSEIEASKTRRKRRLSTTDRLWKTGLSDDGKRLKTEDDFQEDTTLSGQEQEKIDKDIDDEKDSITKRPPKTDTIGFDEVEKQIIGRSSPLLDGVEQEQERGEGSDREDWDRDLKYRKRRIQLRVSSRQTENYENGDEDLTARRTDTILVIPSYRNSEISQNATEECNDKRGSLTMTRAPLDGGGGGRGRTRTAGRGRGGRAVGTAATKLADSTTTMFDAKCHAVMTSDCVDNRTSTDDDVIRFGASVVQSDDAGRAFDGNARKTNGRNRSRMRRVDSKFPKETPEESRICEFPVNSFSGTLFPSATTSSGDVLRFSEMTSQAFPVRRSSECLPGLRFRYGARATDLAESAKQSRSGSTLGSGPTRSAGRQPEPEVVETRTARRRSRRRRNGVVSSTTFDYPSAELMTSLSRSVTSLYDRQVMMTSSSSSSLLTTDVHSWRNDSRCRGVTGVMDSRVWSADGFSNRGTSTGVLYRPRFQDLFDFRRILDFADGVPLPGDRILAPGGDTCAPFVYDHCGALDLTLPKIRSD